MTMPKKGTRKIVIDNIAYKYVVKPYNSWDNSVTIEMPDGTYISKDIEGSVTPSIIRSIIEEN
jgi:hypothetical protein